MAKDAPVGFAQIRLRFDIDTDVSQEKLDPLLKLTERYCVVYQTLKSGPAHRDEIESHLRSSAAVPRE